MNKNKNIQKLDVLLINLKCKRFIHGCSYYTLKNNFGDVDEKYFVCGKLYFCFS